MLKFFVLLLLVNVVVKAAEEKLGFANVKRSGGHGGAAIIWDQMKVVKAGTIKTWEYYNKGTSNVPFSYVAIWRPTEIKNQFQLVGFIKLAGGNAGPTTYHVPKPYQIAVKPGDVFGVIVFDHSNYGNFFSGRVARYSFKDNNEQSGHILIGRNLANGRKTWTLSELNIGQRIMFFEDHHSFRYRIYSIRATINNSNTVTLC